MVGMVLVPVSPAPAQVRALEGSMGPAVKELNDAAARLEKLVAGKSEL